MDSVCCLSFSLMPVLLSVVLAISSCACFALIMCLFCSLCCPPSHHVPVLLYVLPTISSCACFAVCSPTISSCACFAVCSPTISSCACFAVCLPTISSYACLAVCSANHSFMCLSGYVICPPFPHVPLLLFEGDSLAASDDPDPDVIWSSQLGAGPQEHQQLQGRAMPQFTPPLSHCGVVSSYWPQEHQQLHDRDIIEFRQPHTCCGSAS